MTSLITPPLLYSIFSLTYSLTHEYELKIVHQYRINIK